MHIPPASLFRSGTTVSYSWHGKNRTEDTEQASLDAGAAEYIVAITRNNAKAYSPAVLAHHRGEYKGRLKRALKGKLTGQEVRDSQNRFVEPLYEVRFEIEQFMSTDGTYNSNKLLQIRHYHSEHRGHSSFAVGHLVCEKEIFSSNAETLSAQDARIEEARNLYHAFLER